MDYTKLHIDFDFCCFIINHYNLLLIIYEVRDLILKLYQKYQMISCEHEIKNKHFSSIYYIFLTQLPEFSQNTRLTKIHYR